MSLQAPASPAWLPIMCSGSSVPFAPASPHGAPAQAHVHSIEPVAGSRYSERAARRSATRFRAAAWRDAAACARLRPFPLRVTAGRCGGGTAGTRAVVGNGSGEAGGVAATGAGRKASFTRRTKSPHCSVSCSPSLRKDIALLRLDLATRRQQWDSETTRCHRRDEQPAASRTASRSARA